MVINSGYDIYVKKKKDILFLIGYYFLILNQVLSQSQLNEIDLFLYLLKFSRWALILYFVLLILYHKSFPKNNKALFWITFCGISVFEMIFYNGGLLLIILSVVVLSSVKTDLFYIFTTHIIALISGVTIVIFSTLLGIVSNQAVRKGFDNLTGFLFRKSNIQYNLGFTNSNVVPIIILFVTLYIMILKRDKMKIQQDIMAIMINFAVFLICGSRSCILLIIAAVIMKNLFVRKMDRSIKITSTICRIAFIFALLFTIALPVSAKFNTPFVHKIDVLLTARITIMRNVLTLFPLNLWGHGDIHAIKSDMYLTLDNGYIALFITRGMVMGTLFIFLIFMMINFAEKNKNLYVLITILVMIIGNLIDNSLLSYLTFPLFIMVFNGTLKMRASTRLIKREKGVF